MLKILTCFKWVIDEAYVKVGASRELILDRVDYKISDYDRNAMEEAVRLREAYGGCVEAITVGPPTATKGLKDALSRGPEKAYFVNDPSFVDLEPSQTAAILADAIKSQIEYDLIICGEGSSDLYARQVGPRLAEKLGIPCITFVNRLQIEDGQVIAERKMEDGVEVVSAPLPVLITVLPDINTPRIPGLRDTLAAAKKPVVNIALSDLGHTYPSCLQTTSILGTAMERNCIKFDADAKGIAELVEALHKAGLFE